MMAIFHVIAKYATWYYFWFITVTLLQVIIFVVSCEELPIREKRRYCKKHNLRSVNDVPEVKAMFNSIIRGYRRECYLKISSYRTIYEAVLRVYIVSFIMLTSLIIAYDFYSRIA